MGQRLVIFLRPEAQAAQHPLDAQLVGVAAGGFEGALQSAITGQRGLTLRGVGHRFLQPGQLRPLGLQRGKHAEHRRVQGTRSRRRRHLWQIADAQPPSAVHRAGVRCLQSSDDAQQAGLPLAVGADQPDAVAVGDAQADVAEYVLSAVGHDQALRADNGHDPLLCTKRLLRREK